jgi:enterochelin esterase family protein
MEEHTMNRILRGLPDAALATLVAAPVQAQITNNPPGGSGPGRGRGVEASVVSAARSPEVNADHTITFRLPAPNARKVRVYTDMPKLGDTPVNGSAGFDMTQDAQGVWSFTTPKLAPSYYQYWFEVDGLTTPDPQNTFVRPASGVYKSVVALPGKEADFMMFRDLPHGNMIEHQYVNHLTKIARRVVVYTPPDYNTGNRKYPVVYLLHGANDYERGWTQTGMANLIMDNLIAEKKAVPAIIVMPFGHEKTGSAGRQPEILALQQALGYTPPPAAARGAAPLGAGPGGPGSGRGVAPSGWSMEKEMLDYVIPYVEKEFRVIKDNDHRAIMGY